MLGQGRHSTATLLTQHPTPNAQRLIARTSERPSAPLQKRRSGFTLVEMVVLIIIIAVLSGVIVPAYSHFYARTKFRQSVSAVVNMLSQARDSAIQSSSETVVRFDAQSAMFIVTIQRPDSASDLPSAMQETQESGSRSDPRPYQLGEDVAVANFENYDQYDPSTGSSSNDASTFFRYREDGSCNGGRFLLHSQDGYQAIVEVLPLTGRVVVQDEQE